MAVEILWDSTKQIACMYDNTTDQAFGPVFSGPSADTEVQEFIDWLRGDGAPSTFSFAAPVDGDGTDPGNYSAAGLEAIVRHWCEMPTIEPDGQRYLGGGNYGRTSR